MNQQARYRPEMPCPRCGYNVVIQLELRIGRCPECGFELPEIAPNNKIAWDIWSRQKRCEVGRY